MSISGNFDSQQSFSSWAQQTGCLDPGRPNRIAVIDAFVRTTSEVNHRGLPIFNNARFIELCKDAHIWGDTLDKVVNTAQKCFHHPRMGFFFVITSDDGAIGRNIKDKTALKRIRTSFSNSCGKGGHLETVFRDIDTEERHGTIPPQYALELKRAATSFYSEQSLVEVFKSTKLLAQNGYTTRRGEIILPNLFSEANGMKTGTVLNPEPKPLGPCVTTKTTQFLFVNQDSIDAALDPRHHLNNPCVLNLANAFSPGGGVEGGSKAQEEDIFRRTNYFDSLYPERNPKLANEIREYQASKKGHEVEKSRPVKATGHDRDNYLVPEHGGIYSPNVCVFRQNAESGFDLMEQPRLLSFVAVAAYNRKVSHKSKLVFGNADYGPIDPTTYKEYTKRKIRAALRIAATHGHEDLVLGAFGCGAFENDPKDIARWYGEILSEDEFKNRFRTVVFAILDKGETRNLTAFCSDPGLIRLRDERGSVHAPEATAAPSATQVPAKERRIQEITDALQFVTGADRDQLIQELETLLQ